MPTTYTCDGCRAELDSKDDLRREQGTVSSSWFCEVCGTPVPSMVAERIKHQQ